jgi:surface antigen
MSCQRLLLLLLIGACLPGAALAQISPFRGTRGAPLNADDIAALTDATNHLLNSQGLKPGAKESWSNPRSGVSGTVTAGNAVRQKGLACRVMQYDYTVPGPRSERNRRLTWCNTHDGWKIGS